MNTKIVRAAARYEPTGFESRVWRLFAFVPQSEQLVVERFGKYSHVAQPGLNFFLPVIDRIAYAVPTQELCFRVEPQTATTKDNVMLTLAGTVYVRFVDPHKAAYGAAEPYRAILQHAQSSMRARVGDMTMDDVFKDRNELNNYIESSMKTAAASWGATIERFELTDVSPLDRKVADALHLQATAEREGREMRRLAEAKAHATRTTAEAEKTATELRAEGERTAAIKAAEAKAEAVRLAAEADAAAVRLAADAEKHRLEQVGTALSSYPEAAKYNLGTLSVEAWAGVARESTVVVVPQNMSDLAGTVAALSPMLRNQLK